MSFPTEIFGDVIVVHAPDELGVDQAEGLAEYLCQLQRRQIVFDLDGTEMVSSAGLTALWDAQDRLHEDGGEIKISTSNPANRKILEITRLDRQFEVFPSVIEAARSFR